MIIRFLKSERMRQFILFGLVGSSGVVVNTIILYLCKSIIGWPLWLSSTLAVEISIISNFFGNHHLTFRKSSNKDPLLHKFIKFQLISLVALTITVTGLLVMTRLWGEDLYLVWNLIAIALAFLVNFALNTKITWKER